jgi:hypothetical protein
MKVQDSGEKKVENKTFTQKLGLLKFPLCAPEQLSVGLPLRMTDKLAIEEL